MTDHRSSTVTQLSEAQGFRRARRRVLMERIFAWLGGRSAELLCYDQVRGLLQIQDTKSIGKQLIPLDAIVGSVGRCYDYTRSFLPLRDSDQTRWTSVMNAVVDRWGVPPIRVYQVGQVYFVVDGNHRVSVARECGMVQIEAHVIEIQTKMHLTPDIQPEGLCVEAEYAAFLERTSLDDTRPHTDLIVSAPGQYPALEAQIEAHRRLMAADQAREVSFQEAAGQWIDQVYLPLIQRLGDWEILDAFPGQTETDLYVRLHQHRTALEAVLGQKVDLDMAAIDLVQQSGFNSKRVLARLRAWVLRAVAPYEL